MGRALDPKKIKSAQRVLEVFEYFTDERREATVMDIARSMGYPQSSTSELLSCLVALGYLQRDRYARTYKPTSRVACLGAWVQPSLFRRGRLFPTVDELARETGETVVVATRVDVRVQYVHTAPANGPASVGPGAEASLLHTASGMALLSNASSDEVRKLVHRLNAYAEPHMRVSAEALIEELRQVRVQGYARAEEADGVMIAVLLTPTAANEQLVLGVLCRETPDDMRSADIVQQLRGAVARALHLAAPADAQVAAPAPPAYAPATPSERLYA